MKTGAPGFLRLALWCGILGGLGEASVHVLRFFRHRFVFVGEETLWLAPIAVSLALLPLAALLAGIQRARGRNSAPLVLPALLFVAALGVFLTYPGLHWGASVLLALGIGVQAAWLYRRRPDPVNRVIHRTVPWLTGLVLLVAGGTLLAERLAGRPVAPAPAKPRPNILLIILDTVRELDGEGGDGFVQDFPRLSARARQGLRFTRAFAASSWTLPSHATMFTGRWPHEHQADWSRPLDDRYPTIAEVLGAAGYATAGFTANQVYVTRASGLGRGFQVWEDFLLSPGALVRSSTLLRMLGVNLTLRRLLNDYRPLARKSAAQLNGEMLDWRRGRDPGRPWFAFLNYFDAHSPYLPPAPYDSLARRLMVPGSPLLDWLARGDEDAVPSDRVRAEAEAAYRQGLHYLDAQVDALLDSLDRLGPGRPTWVVLTSDHGEEFGEHGRMGHGHNLYRTTVQVPLVVWGPGVTAGTVAAPVSLRNLAATLAQWGGGDASVFPGRPLLDLAGAGDSIRAELTPAAGHAGEADAGHRGAQVSWREDSVRVIRWSGGAVERYPMSDARER